MDSPPAGRPGVAGLPEPIAAFVEQHPAALSFAAVNLETGARLAYDPDRVVPAASVIKTAILGAMAGAVDGGRLAWDEPVTFDASALDVAGSGALRHFRPPVTLSLYNVAALMIIVSDNTATNRCIDLVGFDGVNAFCRGQGLTATRLNRYMRGRPAIAGEQENVTTAGDQCRLAERLWRGEVVSPEASRTVLEILGGQQLSQRIPRYLQDVEGATFQHKTGTIPGIAHDAGIIRLPGRAAVAFAGACQGWRSKVEVDEAIGRLAWLAADGLVGRPA